MKTKVFTVAGIDTGKTEQEWVEELSNLQRDAERYRYLRDNGAGRLHTYLDGVEHSLLPDELDRFIDNELSAFNPLSPIITDN